MFDEQTIEYVLSKIDDKDFLCDINRALLKRWLGGEE